MSNIYFPKWMQILPLMKQGTLTKIAKQSDTTYSHTAHVYKELRDLGFITISKTGRRCNCRLTSKGKLMVDYIIKIESEIKPKNNSTYREILAEEDYLRTFIKETEADLIKPNNG